MLLFKYNDIEDFLGSDSDLLFFSVSYSGLSANLFYCSFAIFIGEGL